MIQDCYIEEIKDIVKEKKLHMSEQELYFAKREMQKNIIEYNMKIYAAALSAIERVTTYHFPELHPEEKEQLTIATILSEIRECLSSSNYISHFRSANSVDSIVLKMKNGQEYVLSIRENKEFYRRKFRCSDIALKKFWKITQWIYT